MTDGGQILRCSRVARHGTMKPGVPAVPPLRTATSDADRDRHNERNKAVTRAPARVPPQRRWPRTIQLFGWPTAGEDRQSPHPP